VCDRKNPPPLQILSGHRILVVEDEALIAFDIEYAIKDAGGIVVGPFATVADAMAPVEQENLSAAILDVRLGAETSLPIARRLAEKGVSFLFYTAYPERIEQSLVAQVVRKPATPDVLIGAVAALIGSASAPNPSNF
jgi:DNA-binding response OmpR family regulator